MLYESKTAVWYIAGGAALGSMLPSGSSGAPKMAAKQERNRVHQRPRQGGMGGRGCLAAERPAGQTAHAAGHAQQGLKGNSSGSAEPAAGGWVWVDVGGWFLAPVCMIEWG